MPEPGADPADARVLRIVAELRDAADDDRVDAEQLPEFGGGRGVGAVAVGKILLRHDLVKGGPLDDRVTAVLHEIVDQKIGDALANIHVRSKDRRNAAIDRRVVEIDDCDPGSTPRSRCPRSGHRGEPRDGATTTLLVVSMNGSAADNLPVRRVAVAATGSAAAAAEQARARSSGPPSWSCLRPPIT